MEIFRIPRLGNGSQIAGVPKWALDENRNRNGTFASASLAKFRRRTAIVSIVVVNHCSPQVWHFHVDGPCTRNDPNQRFSVFPPGKAT